MLNLFWWDRDPSEKRERGSGGGRGAGSDWAAWKPLGVREGKEETRTLCYRTSQCVTPNLCADLMREQHGKMKTSKLAARKRNHISFSGTKLHSAPLLDDATYKTQFTKSAARCSVSPGLQASNILHILSPFPNIYTTQVPRFIFSLKKWSSGVSATFMFYSGGRDLK